MKKRSTLNGPRPYFNAALMTKELVKTKDGILVHCKFDALIDPRKLKAHPKNRNRHSKDQLKRLAKIIEYQGWRYAIKVSLLSKFMTSGHGRQLTALFKKWKEIPVVYQHYEDETQEYADVQADNAIGSWAELDISLINLDISDLGPMFDIDLLGIQNFVVEPLDKLADGETLENFYTKKITAPIYEIQGEKPKIQELYEGSKWKQLLEKIAHAEIHPDIQNFLTLAAYRHIAFNYQKIAEFYAHADEDVQRLMEESALVIIDFDQAIENGFVELTKDLAEAYEKNEANNLPS